MKKQMIIVVLVACAMLCAGNASALDIGTNITIPDTVASGMGWYGVQEDQEVEPNSMSSQIWDLEGFYTKNGLLSMVGGYDFANGVEGFNSGDIFIDTTGDVQYGSMIPTSIQTSDGYSDIVNSLGYDYALSIDFAALKYDVFALTADSTLITPYFNSNDTSNAWRYNYGGRLLLEDVPFSYVTGYDDAAIGNGLTGGLHNVVSGFDLAFLDGKSFTTHFTMGCGNDNLMGSSAVVPEPMSMILLGFGALSLSIRRKMVV